MRAPRTPILVACRPQCYRPLPRADTARKLCNTRELSVFIPGGTEGNPIPGRPTTLELRNLHVVASSRTKWCGTGFTVQSLGQG